MSRITDYPALTAVQPDDVLPIVDVHDATQSAAGTTKKVTAAVLSGGLVPVGDPTGVADSTAVIQAALNTGFAYLAPVNPATGAPAVYKVSSTLTMPSGSVLYSPSRSFGVPTGNYGNAGLPLTGAIIQPSASFSGAAVVSLGNAPAAQAGGQYLRGFTVDGSQLPSNSAVAGIQAVGWVAGVTMREVLVWSGFTFGQMTGPGIDARTDGSGHSPDFWDVAFCKVSGINGTGVNFSGLADSYVLGCESTGNGGDNWKVTNCNNTRFAGCKGEGSNTGLGWNLTGASGFTGSLYFTACTSASNGGGGWQLSGTGTGTYLCTGSQAADGITVSGTNLIYGFGLPPAGNQVQPEDMGFVGWSLDPVGTQGTGAVLPTGGVVNLIKIPVRSPRVATGVRLDLTATGGTLTSGQNFTGLYSSAGSRIGTSADQTSNWGGSTGNIDAALSGGPFSISPPFVWVAVLFNGTTGPSLTRGFTTAGPGVNGKLAAAQARFGTILTGQQSLPSSFTPSSIALTQTPFCAVVY